MTADDLRTIRMHKLYKEKHEVEMAEKEHSWTATSEESNHNIFDFINFALPFMWQGSCAIKCTTVTTFVMIIISKIFTVCHPLILGAIVKSIACDRTK